MPFILFERYWITVTCMWVEYNGVEHKPSKNKTIAVADISRFWYTLHIIYTLVHLSIMVVDITEQLFVNSISEERIKNWQYLYWFFSFFRCLKNLFTLNEHQTLIFCFKYFFFLMEQHLIARFDYIESGVHNRLGYAVWYGELKLVDSEFVLAHSIPSQSSKPTKSHIIKKK